MTFDDAKRELQKLVNGGKIQPVDQNEASVRFHILDVLLETVLGWDRGDIEVEHFYDEGRTDYEIGKPIRWLLEAKRRSIAFPIPSGSSEKPISVRALCDYSDDTKETLEQALGYCAKRGIQIGAISNGEQLIVFIGSRTDSLPPAEGYALVFPDLAAIESRFVQFWECLSPAGVAAGTLLKILKADVLAPPPSKLARQIPEYPGYKNRNPSATELQILGGLFLEDITRDVGVETEFLEETYCSSGALSQYALVSKEILRARYSTVFEKAGEVSASTAATKKGINPELLQDVVASSMGKRPILLVGDVGSGKSMFVRHLIKVDAAEQFDRSIVFYVDFGSKPALATDLQAYVLREIERQLREDYGVDTLDGNFVRSVYYLDLQRFSRGIYGPLKTSNPDKYAEKEIEFLDSQLKAPEAHLRKSLTHVSKSQKKPVIVFLDNVDQRPTAFQEQVFLIANGLSAEWPVTTFVSLRPETFIFSKTRGSLTGYQPRVFTIEPPRVDQVVAARLRFARRQLEKTNRFPWMPQGFTINSDTLLGYIQMLEHAFTRNHELIELVDNMASGNLREALGMVTAFVGSGHVDSRKIIQIIKEDGYYTLPFHEFLRAAIFGDNVFFDPAESQFANILDISTTDPKEHFLVPLMLSFIESSGHIGDRDGYVAKSAIDAFAQSLGFHPRQTDGALLRCGRARLRLIQQGPDEEVEYATRFRITTAGAYSYKRLLQMFSYLDAMVVDTPVIDPSVREKITDAQMLDERITRMRVFVGYLDDCWGLLRGRANVPFDWDKTAYHLKAELENIAGRLPH